MVLPGLFMGLHADDWFHVRDRPSAAVLGTFAGDWNEGVRGQGGFYRPVARLSFHLDHVVFGLRAWGYHLTNGLLFLALLGAVYTAGVLLAGGTARWGIAAAVFLLLALNPVKNEALYWVSGRTDLLAAVPLLWAFVLALYAMRTGLARWAIAANLLLFVAMLAKEVALAGCLILPVTCLLLASRDLPRIPRQLLLWTPIALGGVYLLVRWLALGGLGGYSPEGEPRALTDFAANGLRMISALLWPWQADTPGPFRLMYVLPGGAAVLVLLALAGRARRAFLACLAGVVLSVLPMLPIDIQPGDGTRVLLVPLSFGVAGIVAVLWHDSRRRSLDMAKVAFLAALAISFQPVNAAIKWDFLSAAKPNREALAQAREWIEEAPPGVPLVLKEAPLERHRRILHPGASLLMAAQTWWHERPGASTDDITDFGGPQLYLRFRADREERVAAHALQTWMEEAVLIRPTREGGMERLHLLREPEEDWEYHFTGHAHPVPHDLRGTHIMGWELTGEGWDGGAMLLQAGVESGGWHRESAALFRRESRVAGWLDDASLPRTEEAAAELHLPWLRTGTVRRMTCRITGRDTFEGE